MSRQQKLIYVPLVGIVILCLIAGVSLAARKHFSKPTRSIKVTKHSVKTPADDTLKYWTADRMRNAKATPLPTVTDLERVKQHPQRPKNSPRPQDA